MAHKLPWQVLAAGEGIEGGYDRDIHRLGKISSSELGAWMGSASIYVLPAKYEPFGLSVLEAGLCGAALVLGDIPSFRELWGDYALYVDPDDTEQLEDTLQMLIHKPWLRREYGERARQNALRYSVSRMIDSYMELYKYLISRKKEYRKDEGKNLLCA